MPRRYKRLQIILPAIVMINPGTQDEHILLLTTTDVSASGVMFASESSFFPNTSVKVVFLLKAGFLQKLKVTFSGRVIRCEPGGFAIAFDEVNPTFVSKADMAFRIVE